MSYRSNHGGQDLNAQDPYEDYEAQKGLWERMKERVFGVDDAEQPEEEERPMPEARRRAALRLETSRAVKVAVRLNPVNFNDARVAADGLKEGQQQIVNLERAQQPVAERIIDFLSGVTYALDGSVDKIGDKVFLFSPANVQVEVDGGADRL